MKFNLKQFFNHKKHIILSMFILLLAIGCIEEFNAKTESFESLLVVEAVLTDEHKNHEIRLSRTFRFEEYDAAAEQRAVVRIQDNQNNEFVFSETAPGIYNSMVEFSAQPTIEYTLFIETDSGEKYTTKSEIIPQDTQIENVYAEAKTDEDGALGVGVFLDSYNPSGEKGYYRYEYEETHKVIVPKYNDSTLILVSQNPITFELVQKTEQKKECYVTNYSISNILESGVDLNTDRIRKTQIRFIPITDYVLANRYSIVVKQYSVSREAYAFYKNLNDFSGSQNLFSQVQPGFIKGNIYAENNENNVIGFFDVSAVTRSERIFFNYQDFYPNSDGPEYPYSCDRITPWPYQLVPMIEENRVVYSQENPCLTADPPIDCDFGPDNPQGPYEVTYLECGDCTTFGTNVIPEFWEE
ncbi:DUF4249 domain-containing protein [Cellulophaga sp. F20128]|uniref:DUF4249 domain-containing protein n=1 Tax=Cellulophaga sp. F20128 TaxID=2926413 RepID=UPI001FF0E442|nr:DUF4249 domain-containing protein [Cellulophaga sp. F20128]MCK0156689.1 DUF4249 domain-containing protein [Cellulophaga sp. F20128]